MRRLLPMLLLAAVPVLLASAGGESESPGAGAERETIEVDHALGHAEVPLGPRNAVVFGYDILDVFSELGIEPGGLVKASLPSYLGDYADEEYADVGTLFEPLFEVIYDLAPEVIFISDRQAAVYDQLAEIAPVVHTAVDPADYLGSLRRNWELVGRLYGMEDRVRTLADEAFELADAVAGRAEEEPALYLMVNTDALSVYGPGSRFGFVHESFGFPAADAGIEVSTHGQTVGFEYLMERNPAVLFVLDRGTAVSGVSTARAVLDNPFVHTTSAYRTGSIVYLDAQAWYLALGGVEANRRIAADLAAALR